VTNPYARHNEESKASFDHVYDLPDPRGYFETLGALDYIAPEHALVLLSRVGRIYKATGAGRMLFELLGTLKEKPE
jgi:hypothetical protein